MHRIGTPKESELFIFVAAANPLPLRTTASNTNRGEVLPEPAINCLESPAEVTYSYEHTSILLML